MLNDNFISNLISIGGDYREVNFVIDALDGLAGSVDILQEELLGEVRNGLRVGNIGLTREALSDIDSLGNYGTLAFRENLTRSIMYYPNKSNDDEVLDCGILSEPFVDDLSSLSNFIGEGFKLRLIELYNSLIILYDAMSEDLYDDIENLKLNDDSTPLKHVLYLSPRISLLGEAIDYIIGDEEIEVYNDIDKAAVFGMCELISTGVLVPDETVFIFTGDLEDEVDNPLPVGSVLGSGYIDMSDPLKCYPINQSVILTLMVNGLGQVDIFDSSELFTDSDGNLRVKLDCLVKRLCVNRDGEFQLIE